MSKTPIVGLLTPTVGWRLTAAGGGYLHILRPEAEFSNLNASTANNCISSQPAGHAATSSRLQEDLSLPSYIWGREPFEESAATRVGPKARLGRRNEAVRRLRDRCRPITVGNTSERCHLWLLSFSTAQTVKISIWYDFYAHLDITLVLIAFN